MEANLRPPTFPAIDCGLLTRGRWRGALFAAAVVFGPALLFWHLHGLWNPNGAYAYGWVVPALAGFLCKFRWDDRPAPSAPLKSAVFFAIAFAVVTLPARWLQEAAPERSVCAWAYALATVGLALALISRAGGAAWLRWFRFPFGFILTAVPWPHGVELFISNFLMRGTAAATVEILCLIGVPSAQAGNLVHIETGVIDIDEACSGIRSLQAMVMIALFLGELFRLKPGRRGLLVALGLGITLMANVLRSVALSAIGFGMGMSAVDRCHDAAGFAILMLSLAGTLFIAFKLRPAMAAPRAAERGGMGLTFPVRLSAALLIWFAAVEISVETWYRAHEPKWGGWRWAIHFPQDRDGFHFIEIPARSLRLLMCDEAQAGTWKEPGGAEWSLYWIRWDPGNPSAEAAKVHRPDVCLNAEGAVMERDMGTRLSLAGRLPFHCYTFRLGDKTLYVFFCLCEEGGATPASNSDPRFEGTGMMQRALQGRRHFGEQSLEIVLSGYSSEESARTAFDALLAPLISIPQSAISAAK